MPPKASTKKVAADEEVIDLDGADPLDAEDNPVDTALVLGTLGNPTKGGLIDMKGFVGAARPLVIQTGAGVIGFVGANWWRVNVNMKLINGVWKTATAGQGLFLDTLLQLFVAWQLARRMKGAGKAVALGILMNQGLAVGKFFSKANPQRFDTVIFQDVGNGNGAPAPALPPENGAANGNGNGDPGATGGIMPGRGMRGIAPAMR